MAETKECSKCLERKPLTEFRQKNNQCKECRYEFIRSYKNTKEGFMKNCVRAAKYHAAKRLKKGRIEAGTFDLTYEDVVKKWDEQGGLCYYSHIPMVTSSLSDWQMSIERLDNDKGYTPDNIVLVCLEFNTPVQWTMAKVEALFEDHPDAYDEDDIEFERKAIVSKPRNRYVKQVIDGVECYECQRCHVVKPRTEYYGTVRDILLWDTSTST